jgi:hypothetical protein
MHLYGLKQGNAANVVGRRMKFRFANPDPDMQMIIISQTICIPILSVKFGAGEPWNRCMALPMKIGHSSVLTLRL